MAEIELRWEVTSEDESAEDAFSGDLRVGRIVRTDARPQRWAYALDIVKVSYGRKGVGYVSSRYAARKALTKAWLTWCERAGLRADL